MANGGGQAVVACSIGGQCSELLHEMSHTIEAQKLLRAGLD